MTIQSFIVLLREVLEKKSNTINDTIRVKLKIRDRFWSAIFLSDFNCLSLSVSKNGTTYLYSDVNEQGEEDVITIKQFLEIEIKENKVTLFELEKLIWMAM